MWQCLLIVCACVCPNYDCWTPFYGVVNLSTQIRQIFTVCQEFDYAIMKACIVYYPWYTPTCIGRSDNNCNLGQEIQSTHTIHVTNNLPWHWKVLQSSTKPTSYLSSKFYHLRFFIVLNCQIQCHCSYSSLGTVTKRVGWEVRGTLLLYHVYMQLQDQASLSNSNV